MARGPAVRVMGIYLVREGDYAVVYGEDLGGRQVELIREHVDGPFSHNISEHGILQRFDKAYWDASNKHVDEYRAKRAAKKSGVITPGD